MSKKSIRTFLTASTAEHFESVQNAASPKKLENSSFFPGGFLYTRRAFSRCGSGTRRLLTAAGSQFTSVGTLRYPSSSPAALYLYIHLRFFDSLTVPPFQATRSFRKKAPCRTKNEESGMGNYGAAARRDLNFSSSPLFHSSFLTPNSSLLSPFRLALLGTSPYGGSESRVPHSGEC